MAAHLEKSPLSIGEKISFGVSIVRLLVLLPFVVMPILIARRDFTAAGLKRAVNMAIARNSISFSLRQTRSLMPGTRLAVESYCAEQNLNHAFVALESDHPSLQGVCWGLHFVDCTPEDKGSILLYFHGGGYVFPLQANSQLAFARRAAKAARAHLVLLEYSLAPDVQYPGQLAQAARAMDWLLERHAADEIIVGGDSAGGNLSLTLLAHLIKPHPNIAPVRLSGGHRLRDVFCVSPRTRNETGSDSFRRNRNMDIVNKEMTQYFMMNWKPAAMEVWAAPNAADNSFWRHAPAQRLTLLAGADEVYVDDIREFARKIGAVEQADAPRQIVVCDGEFHEQCAVDLGQGLPDGKMMKAVLSRLASTST